MVYVFEIISSSFLHRHTGRKVIFCNSWHVLLLLLRPGIVLRTYMGMVHTYVRMWICFCQLSTVTILTCVKYGSVLNGIGIEYWK